MRLEYRGDFSDSPFFADDKGKLSKSQHALIVGLVCAFGGKISVRFLTPPLQPAARSCHRLEARSASFTVSG
jgi:hypothetical protein